VKQEATKQTMVDSQLWQVLKINIYGGDPRRAREKKKVNDEKQKYKIS
jgi:hypothetical protein